MYSKLATGAAIALLLAGCGANIKPAPKPEMMKLQPVNKKLPQELMGKHIDSGYTSDHYKGTVPSDEQKEQDD